MTDLTRSDVAELARLLSAGEVSAVEVTRAHLDRIAADDDRLGSYLHVQDDAALAAAGRPARGLAGRPGRPAPACGCGDAGGWRMTAAKATVEGGAPSRQGASIAASASERGAERPRRRPVLSTEARNHAGGIK